MIRYRARSLFIGTGLFRRARIHRCGLFASYGHRAVSSQTQPLVPFPKEAKYAQINTGVHRTTYTSHGSNGSNGSNMGTDEEGNGDGRVVSLEAPRDLSTIYTWIAASDAIPKRVLTKGPTWAALGIKMCRNLAADKAGAPEVDHGIQAPPSTLRTGLDLCYPTPGPDAAIEFLDITEDAPSNKEWPVLAERFPSVRWLLVDAGFEEDWNDLTFPLEWPLEVLVVSSSCGCLVTTPAIVDGIVPHVILQLTSGLRFEGPTTQELSTMDELEEEEWIVDVGQKDTKDAPLTGLDEEVQDIPSYKSPTTEKGKSNLSDEKTATKNDDSSSLDKPPPPGQNTEEGSPLATGEAAREKRTLRIISIPDRVNRWMYSKYKDGVSFPNYEPHLDKPPSRMHTLEILENDAIDTFNRFALACSHVVDHLQRLNVRSTSGLDLTGTPEDVFPQMLSELSRLRHLQLSLGESTFGDPETLTGLHRSFPPNLERLDFRGPPMLAQDDTFSQWIAAFGHPDYLPKLKTLSFVLDADSKRNRRHQEPQKEQGEQEGQDAKENNEEKVAEALWAEELSAAQKRVDELLEATRARGVTVETFHDPWMDQKLFN